MAVIWHRQYPPQHVNIRLSNKPSAPYPDNQIMQKNRQHFWLLSWNLISGYFMLILCSVWVPEGWLKSEDVAFGFEKNIFSFKLLNRLVYIWHLLGIYSSWVSLKNNLCTFSAFTSPFNRVHAYTTAGTVVVNIYYYLMFAQVGKHKSHRSLFHGFLCLLPVCNSDDGGCWPASLQPLQMDTRQLSVAKWQRHCQAITSLTGLWFSTKLFFLNLSETLFWPGADNWSDIII